MLRIGEYCDAYGIVRFWYRDTSWYRQYHTALSCRKFQSLFSEMTTTNSHSDDVCNAVIPHRFAQHVRASHYRRTV